VGGRARRMFFSFMTTFSERLAAGPLPLSERIARE
jgi:hypothetical protein